MTTIVRETLESVGISNLTTQQYSVAILLSLFELLSLAAGTTAALGQPTNYAQAYRQQQQQAFEGDDEESDYNDEGEYQRSAGINRRPEAICFGSW